MLTVWTDTESLLLKYRQSRFSNCETGSCISCAHPVSHLTLNITLSPTLTLGISWTEPWLETQQNVILPLHRQQIQTWYIKLTFIWQFWNKSPSKC